MDRRTFLSAAACGMLGASSAPLARAQAQRRFDGAARYSAEHGGAAFLVVRNGVVLAEDYPSGGDPGARWPLGAATRAFAPLLAAALIHDRLLALDEPVALTLGEWGADPVKSAIAVRGLLNGTSGMAFARGGPQDTQTALMLAPQDQPGARFIDDAAPYVIFTELARRKLSAGAVEPDPATYLTGRALAAIGCTPIGWTRASDGAPRFDTGAFATARGFACVGELIRRGGIWRGEELADAYTLGEAIHGSFAEARAGFGLWVAAPSRQPISFDSDLWRAPSPAPADLAMAAGNGGQRLYVAPSRALVVARLPHNDAAAAPWSDAQFLSLLWADL